METDRGRRAGRGAAAAAAALFSLLATGACFAPPREPIRIGLNVWPPYELLYLAREKNLLAAEKVEIGLVDFSSYTGILRSYHQGNIDGFFATLNELLVAENFQDPPAMVLVVDYSSGADALVARDGVADLRGLRGKRIAYEESALGSYVLERALEMGGLGPDEVVAINRLPEEGEQDFRALKVDAVITYEPGVGKLVRQHGGRVIFSSKAIPGEIVDALVVRRSILESRPDEVRALLRAWFRALDLLKASPGEAATIMARREHVTPEEFLEGLRGIHLLDLEENLALMGTTQAPGPLHLTAARLGEFLVRHGMAKKTASAADLLHPEILGSL
jgi:NitT/TauT family transport system substrate-binding protein